MIDTTSQLTLFGEQEVSSINKSDLSNKSNQTNQDNKANQNNQNNQICLPSGKTELRDYQKDIKKQCYDLIKAGTKRILVYAPTGSGKTVVLSSICEDVFQRNKRVMLVVHRDFLVEQSIAAMIRFDIEEDLIGVIKDGYKENRDRPIQIAGIQSLQNRPTPENLDVIILDECHTTAFFAHYQKIKEDTPDAIHLGFSASPWRQKQVEYFGMHYDSIVLGPSVSSLISKGNLVPPSYYGWGGIADLSEIDNGDSEFNSGAMEKIFLESGVIEEIVIRIKELASDRTGIIFNSGVMQSLLQTKALNDAGIVTKHMDSLTPFEERKEIFRQLGEKEIQCISSIGCLTEGFDVPSISFVVLSRATKSRALYVQMCGRGLRPFPGKKDCLILDFGGNVKRIGYLTKNFPITLEQRKKSEGETLKECDNCHSLVSIFARICPICGHEFCSESGEDELELEYEKKFGEIFPPEIQKLVRYVRSQRKIRFTKGYPPDDLWTNYKNKFGDELYDPNKEFKNEWLLGAIFGGYQGEVYQQIFLRYLERFAPTLDPKRRESWIRHHIDLEFGREYKKKENNNNKKANSYQLKDWTDILNCSYDDDWDTIKKCYRTLVSLTHPDKAKVLEIDEKEATEKMKLLNWAYDYAKSIKNNNEN